MAVKDRLTRRLPRLGIIRLGYKAKNARGTLIPFQSDHFVLTDAPKLQPVYGATLCAACQAEGHYKVATSYYKANGVDIDACEAHLTAAQQNAKTKKADPLNVIDLPPTGREMDVLLPWPDIERNFTAHYQVWANGVLICQGDGEAVEMAVPFTVQQKKKGISVYTGSGPTLVSDGTARVDFTWNGLEFKSGDPVPCSGKARDRYPHCAACRLNGLLKVMMAQPDLFEFGYYQISTGSGRNHDIIMGTLEAMAAPDLRGIKFKLRMVQEQTTYKDDAGKRHKTRKWFLQLIPEANLTREALVAGAHARAEAPGLPAPKVIEPDVVYDEEEPVPPPYAQDHVQLGEQIEEGKLEEPGEKPKQDSKWTKKQLLKSNGKRPYTPEVVQQALAQRIGDDDGTPITDAQVGLVAGKLEECFAGDKRAQLKRHSVTIWLLGKESTRDLTKAEASAILDWILASQEKDSTGDYSLHVSAPAEAAAIVKASLIVEGQLEIPF